MIKITLLKIIFITTTLFSQSTMVDVQGTHTLTQTSGMSIYETIDLCLRTAIKNGLVDLVFDENEINPEETSDILQMIDQSVEMCVIDPQIINQIVDGNNFTITAKGKVDKIILYAILGLDK